MQPEDGRVYADVAGFDEILQTPDMSNMVTVFNGFTVELRIVAQR